VVEGDGVIGQQPVLEPGNKHQYVSGCNLKSGMGKMKGYYFMERLVDGKILEIIIPEFQLISGIFNN
jgi:ApaG protein